MFESATGNKVKISFKGEPAIAADLKQGAADLVITNTEVVDELATGGEVAGNGKTLLMISKVGVAVKAGAPKPGFSTPEKFKAALMAAVRETELADSPLGKTVRLDAYGNPVYDVYIRKVVRRPDGKYWNVPVEVLPKRFAVLEIRSRNLHEAARLFAYLPGYQAGLNRSLRRARRISAAPFCATIGRDRCYPHF